MAPSRPLVNQQMAACNDIMKIPEDDTILLEGGVYPERRTALWQNSRLIFCTPQVALNDLKEGRLDAKSIVCIVIDEAHKATVGFAYTTFIQLLSTFSQHHHILALSATPGTDLRKIQTVRTIV